MNAILLYTFLIMETGAFRTSSNGILRSSTNNIPNHIHIHNRRTVISTNTQLHTPTKIYSSSSTASSSDRSMPQGISKRVVQAGNGPFVNVGDVATVKYSCSAMDAAVATSVTFSQSSAVGEKLVAGEGLMVDGWEYALLSMRAGERSVFEITDATSFGYGAAGVPPVVGPNAQLTFDIQVMNVEQGVDLGTIASADPLKPRDPKSIADAYSTRRELAALEEANKKEGLEGLLEKVQSYYFFGFFEGETGEQAPWYLRPSLTFPLAFAVVGAAFYVSIKTGAIYERGSQATDELD
eukprot:CAMPEP_0116067646 /NCGR_PEP_ID=MMETSP0322-20121206/11174_1 /TAXON_ID=163516 /ORGANISM="Leptocylindrus danicus var. apora, Strain B651" /LENGTH=294 /DNA_ID=CAMNT_0003554575 /DNA_START=189 /DNA_END=1070 /DNA_ORIENTATION=-